VVGPIEATALGNILVQTVALGTLPDITVGRRVVTRSFEQSIYEPHASADWNVAIGGFDALINVSH